MMAAVMVTVMMVEKEGVSVREPSNAANEFGQAVGEVGTRLPGKIQDVCLPMVSQCDSLLSDTRACPAPHGASESDAAGGMTKESHLERLKIIGSNPWGLHGDIFVVVDVCQAWRLTATRWTRT